MRIVVFTDSLGRARPDLAKSSTTYDQVYFSLLKARLNKSEEVECILLTNEGIDSKSAIELSKKSVAFRSPDIVIYQLGINDCSPRVFKKNSSPIIFKKWFRKLTFDIGAKFITRFRYRITKFRKLTYVSPLEFESNFTQMKNEVKKYSPNAEFMAISIAESFDWMNNRSFGHLNNVRKYNSILDKVFPNNVIHLNLLVPDVENRLIFDGVHLTKNAHQKIADSLFEKIQELKIEKKL